jgi:hypothetical protein
LSSARTPERLWFVGNWSREPVTFRVPYAVSDLMAPAALEGQRHLDVGPWGVRLLREAPEP